MPSQPNATRYNSNDSGTAKARLISIGSSAPHEYQLDKQTVNIGSNRSNDVVVNDTTVSRRHATITHLPRLRAGRPRFDQWNLRQRTADARPDAPSSRPRAQIRFPSLYIPPRSHSYS